jgi:hypothetical protein
MLITPMTKPIRGKRYMFLAMFSNPLSLGGLLTTGIIVKNEINPIRGLKTKKH